MTMRFNGFGAFAAHLLTIEADLKLAEEAAVVQACKLISETAQEMIGHPHDFWPPLQPDTIARKAHGDTPLLETGDLRNSISWDAPHHEGREVVGYVGSDNVKAVWHELGTSRIPPRPFLSTAAAQQEEKIVEMAGKLIHGALIHGGPNYLALKEAIHVLRHAWHAAKELGHELLKEQRPDE